MASPIKGSVPAAPAPEAEVYTPERKAAFLLESCFTREEYEKALEEVRRMGLDPDAIPHKPPVR